MYHFNLYWLFLTNTEIDHPHADDVWQDWEAVHLYRKAVNG